MSSRYSFQSMPSQEAIRKYTFGFLGVRKCTDSHPGSQGVDSGPRRENPESFHNISLGDEERILMLVPQEHTFLSSLWYLMS